MRDTVDHALEAFEALDRAKRKCVSSDELAAAIRRAIDDDS